ncbi:MAG: hypothetical protein ABIK09_17515 [Pseudomonadota bacterium]
MDGRNGLLLLSKHPLKETSHRVLDSFLLRRAVLHARLRVGGGDDLGECPCTDSAVALVLWTPCRIGNDAGTCPGKRVCTAAGLGACDAAEAAAETCNGVDDDCDGVTDEETCDDGNPCTEDASPAAAAPPPPASPLPPPPSLREGGTVGTGGVKARSTAAPIGHSELCGRGRMATMGVPNLECPPCLEERGPCFS